MEETIRLGYSGAGKHFLKSAAGFCALLGMALLLNPVSDGTEEKKPNWQDITELEIAGNKVRAGSREGTDAEMLVFRTLLLQERVKKELVLTEKAVPEGCLILPDISDGNMWEAVQPEAPDAAAGAGNAVWVESKERIREGLSQGQSGAGNEMWNQTVPKDTDRAGAEAPPVEPEEPIGAGVETNPITPGHSSGAGPEADPIKPEDPPNAGTEGEPIAPEGPSDAGTEGEAIVPEGPSDVGIEAEPIAPERPPDAGTEGEPIVPENPGGNGTDDADQWGSGSAGNDDTDQDNGDEGNGEQGAASCFVLDEMGMLCGFLPEYAEISDGCLTLPAECTGIRRGAFTGCGAGILELYIPAGAAVIEEGAFSGLVSLEWKAETPDALVTVVFCLTVPCPCCWHFPPRGWTFTRCRHASQGSQTRHLMELRSTGWISGIVPGFPLDKMSLEIPEEMESRWQCLDLNWSCIQKCCQDMR